MRGKQSQTKLPVQDFLKTFLTCFCQDIYSEDQTGIRLKSETQGGDEFVIGLVGACDESTV